MYRAFIVILVLLIMPTIASAETPEEKGLAIALEADRRNDGFQDSTSHMLMTLKNKHGKESIRKPSPLTPAAPRPPLCRWRTR